jgi:two-component system LytT family sensor kinase
MTGKAFVRTFLYDLVITVIVSAGLIYNDPSHWFGYLYGSLIFTNCIGFSIHILVHLVSPRIAKFSAVPRLSILLVLFLIGGFVGTELGWVVFSLAAGMEFSGTDHSRLLSFNLLLAAIFGSIAVLYFSLKERADRMAIALKEKELNEERLTRLKIKAELEALQTKINPHFLFNTLNSIASLISENPKAAESTVEKLSELFRYTLKNAESSNVTLTEELELVRTYLEIEKVRFGGRLQYEIVCENELKDVQLPALLIQPLVENSIKHAIATAVQGGTIKVEAKQVSNECVISVHDSGKGFQDARNEGGFGLMSIQERLRLRYGDKASLQIVEDDHTHIVITLPIL